MTIGSAQLAAHHTKLRRLPQLDEWYEGNVQKEIRGGSVACYLSGFSNVSFDFTITISCVMALIICAV